MDFPKIDIDLIDAPTSMNLVQELNDVRSKYIFERALLVDNAPIPTLAEDLTTVREFSERIYILITSGWGLQELQYKLVKMLHIDTQDRKGFPPDVGIALIRISVIHQEEFNFIQGNEITDNIKSFKDIW